MLQSRGMRALKKHEKRILLAIALLFIAISGFLLFKFITTDNTLLATEIHLQNTKSELETAQERIVELTEHLATTTELLTLTEEERLRLTADLEDEKERNDAFDDQIREITGTVGTLDKLAKTDPELLQKYSKVFFLNEHYQPAKLKEIDKKYLYNEDDPKFLNAQVKPFFEDMLEDALDDDVEIWVISAFRSFDKQAQLKGQYTVTYGSGANAFSADQGYSEHQLGTTFDFTTRGLNGDLLGFENTEAYDWLIDNAHKYGFTLSYPADNSFYVFEPWHWRFVGTELADDLHDDGKHFYDLDQREIDEYLVSLFD